MTVQNKDELTIKPFKSLKDADLPVQAIESIELNDIGVHLDGYADIYYSLEKQVITDVDNTISFKSEVPAVEAILTMNDLIKCFDALWPTVEPARESVVENKAKNNSVKSYSKIKHERNLK